VEKNVPDALAARSRSGSPRPVRLAAKLSKAAIDSNDRASRRQSRKLAGATHRAGLSGLVSHAITSRSDSGNGSGRSTTAFITEKMAVFAPIPIARETMAASARMGCRRHKRSA
jgi:hypothetical protein